jgi:O-antigen/teichoic acid export membrane protein
MKSLTSKVAANTVVQSISKVIMVATSIITISLLTRYLGEEGFGEYTTVMTYLGLFGIIVDMGMYLIVVREVAKEDADAEGILGNVLGIRLLMGGLILAMAPVLAVLIFPYSNKVDVAIAIGAIGFLLISLNQVVSVVFQVNLVMWKLMVGEVLGRLSILGITYYYILRGGDLWTFIVANVLGNIVLLGFSYWLAAKYVKLLPKFEWSKWKLLLAETAPLAVVTLLSRIYFSIDTIFLSVFRSQVEVGIYGLPYKVLDILISFPAIFAGLVFPAMSRYAAANNMNDLKRIYHKSFEFILIMVVPIFVGLCMTSKHIISLLGGDGFVDSPILLQILSLAVVFIFFTTLANNLIIAVQKQAKLVWVALASAVFNVVLNVTLIPIYSYWAASMIAVATQFLVLILTGYYVWVFTKMGPNFAKWWQILVSSGVMALVLYYLRDYSIFILIFVSIVIYFGLMYLVGGIDREMIFNVLGRESKK